MRWVIALGKLGSRCGSCGTAILEGEPYLLLAQGRIRRCMACAKAQEYGEPPAEIWQPKPDTDAMDEQVKGIIARFKGAAGGT